MEPRSGLVSDFGGVLTTSILESFNAFCELEGLAPDALLGLFGRDHAARDLIVALETGRIDTLDFETQLADLLGVSPETLIDRMFATIRLDEEMLAAVAELRRRGVRTCLLSNSWGTGIYARSMRVMELFEASVISGEVGLRKPDPAIYELALERLGLPAEACVFVDDLPFNLPPAEELGMAVVHHVGPAETVPQLERLFGVPLAAA